MSITVLVWLLMVPLQINSRAYGAKIQLISECASNAFVLHWSGAAGIKLQQATNLANPIWVDVPGSEAASSCTLPMTNAMALFRLVGPGTPDDGDGLADWFEELGWDIFIDTHGYGTDGLVIRHVTSDPGFWDTDGDGIDDYWEWMLGTDPRSVDTDADGLSDYEEWFKWQTSPTSVDTDGDSRGPNHNLPPKAQLFDGNELSLLHTSPTLEDTDGDGRTDYEEYNQPGRNVLVAEVPKLDVQLVDAVDIRLDVQYAEETGKTYEYGTELSQSTTTSHSSYNENSMEASLTVGAEYEFGLFGGATVSAEVSVGYGHVWSTTDETAQTSQTSYSTYNTDSRTRTETAASGSMSGGIRLVNTGPITYTLTDFGLTVRYWQAGGTANGKGSFKTLATLVPPLGSGGITLAPGDSTPVLQVQATGLNASRVKEFMARPNSLYLDPAFYELENAQGLNFDYLEEVTRWRTARVEIDYGNGTNEAYRVATNVERNDDGSYAGVAMGFVMSNILHIPFQTVPIRTLVPTNASNEQVLYGVRSVVTTSVTNGFWIAVWSGEGTLQARTNFEHIVLRAGDEILLSFIRDEDGDGLFAGEEQHYRTDDSATADSDGDGLSDVFEARTGWDVVVLNRTNHVYSDPRAADQDGDGLGDLLEYERRTDPTRPDTDQDGLVDGLDSHPLTPARVLRVKAPQGTNSPPAGDGSTWALALTNLQDALTIAANGLGTTNSDDDVAEIWVAAGIYKPTTTTNRSVMFALVNNTALYGGFSGVETKLSQRNPDPLLNGTVLSGDLSGNDSSTYNPAVFGDNSFTVCAAGLTDGQFVPTNRAGPGTILDGFSITGGNSEGYGGGMVCFGNPLLRNLLFRANHAINAGALYIDGYDRPVLVSDCLFLQNSAEYSGGAMYFVGYYPSGLVLTNCQFIQNETRVTGADTARYGGAALMLIGGGISIEDCNFSLNNCLGYGGAMYFGKGSAGGWHCRISRSVFRENRSTKSGGAIGMYDYWDWNPVGLEVLQSVFWGNQTGGGTYRGGAISIASHGSGLYVVNSTFNTNKCGTTGGAIWLGNAAVGPLRTQALVENSIVWGNSPAQNIAYEPANIISVSVRTSCLTEAGSWPSGGNLNADPMFVDKVGGNLRLQSGSPCIDRGNNYADYHPAVPGYQLLPTTDLDGNWRIVDGNGDHVPIVDMGAYEQQGQ